MSIPRLPPGIAYDAALILGLGEAACEPLSVAEPGEMVIHVGAWSLQDLRTCKTVVRHSLMYNQDWYNGHPFSHEKLTPGVYRVRLLIPGSNRKNFNEQTTLLHDGEVVAPAALVAVVFLCLLTQAGQNLFGNDWTAPPRNRSPTGTAWYSTWTRVAWASSASGMTSARRPCGWLGAGSFEPCYLKPSRFAT
ncbi:MAG: hypothetical protein QM775_30925 [Pirellulales bacterium]